MIPSKHSLISLLSGLTLLITTGCTNQTATNEPDTGTGNSQTGEVNLYTSRHYDTDEEFYDNFTAKTGIKVNIIEGKGDELIERIKSEGRNSPADVFITVDVGRLWRAKQEGILQPISSSSLESAIADNLRSPDGSWFGLSKRARIIVYHTDRVNPDELSSYEALAEPQWKDRFCIRSSSNIYNQSLVASKIEEKGVEKTEEWVKGLVNNFAREPEGNDTAQIKAVAAGECDVALVNHYYVARLKQSEEAEDKQVVEKIGVFFPKQKDGGTHINISGGGVTANAPNKENAVKFLEYLVTPKAQEVFANNNNELPVVANVKPNSVVTSFGDIEESGLNIAAYGEKSPEAVKVMDRAAWK